MGEIGWDGWDGCDEREKSLHGVGMWGLLVLVFVLWGPWRASESTSMLRERRGSFGFKSEHSVSKSG